MLQILVMAGFSLGLACLVLRVMKAVFDWLEVRRYGKTEMVKSCQSKFDKRGQAVRLRSAARATPARSI